MNTFLTYLKLNWIKFLVAFVFIVVLIALGFFLREGLSSYFALESFSRRQISAYMTFFLIIGIFTVFIQLPLFFGMQYY